MREKNYYTKLGRFYTKRALELKRTIVWEAKITKTKSLPFSCLEPHQEEKLLESKRAFNHKIADVGILKKPFDGITVYDAFAVIVIIFYEPRNEIIYEIPIRDFIAERELSKRKSLTFQRAREISTITVDL